jgi:hypothetical protein
MNWSPSHNIGEHLWLHAQLKAVQFSCAGVSVCGGLGSPLPLQSSGVATDRIVQFLQENHALWYILGSETRLLEE